MKDESIVLKTPFKYKFEHGLITKKIVKPGFHHQNKIKACKFK